jgi:hypothetical protein
MGQQKGNPTPSYQNEAYEALRPNTGARENRNYGTKPVMIDDNTTLNEVVDITFETDAVAAMVSASLNTTIYAVSASIGNNITAVSSSINTTIGAVSSSINSRITSVSASAAATYITSASMVNTLTSFIVYGGPGGGHVNDAAAALNGCPIGGLYHTAGTVKVRLT